MLLNDSKPSSDALQSRTSSGALWLLIFGLLLALAGDIREFVKVERLERDLAAMQQTVQSQFAEMKELQSGALEQNLRRFDELNKQFEDFRATTRLETRSEVRRLLGDDEPR